MLLDRGADPAPISNGGRSALHVAVEHSRALIVKMLLEEHIVSPSARDDKGRTALDLAASRGRLDLIKIRGSQSEFSGQLD